MKDKFFYINIRDYLALGTDNKAGEPMFARVLSGFSCSKNPDAEHFLKKNAIEFAKKNQSVTYLVFSVESKELLGYFTLALKPLTVRGEVARWFAVHCHNHALKNRVEPQIHHPFYTVDW